MNNATQSLETLRKRIEHEDNLLNQRVSWVVSSQAFLLTGYAILLNGPQVLRRERFVRTHYLLMPLIPITSIAVTMLIWLAILAGILAMRDLRVCAARHPNYDANHIQGRALTRRIGLAVPALIPIAFMVTWLLLIMR
jgi:hypothetical protein